MNTFIGFVHLACKHAVQHYKYRGELPEKKDICREVEIHLQKHIRRVKLEKSLKSL